MYNEYLVLFSVNRWPLDVLSFLIHGFGINKVQSGTNVCSWKFLSKKDCEGVTNQFWAAVMPEPGGPGGPLVPPPIFGRSVNPIPTGEGILSPPITTGTPHVFHLPASLTYKDGCRL